MRGKIGTTGENLKISYQEERALSEEEYPGMVKDADQGSTAVKKAFAQSMETDAQYAGLYKSAIEEMSAEREVTYYVCRICGHISEGMVPENCPVCWAVSGRFQKVD